MLQFCLFCKGLKTVNYALTEDWWELGMNVYSILPRDSSSRKEASFYGGSLVLLSQSPM